MTFPPFFRFLSCAFRFLRNLKNKEKSSKIDVFLTSFIRLFDVFLTSFDVFLTSFWRLFDVFLTTFQIEFWRRGGIYYRSVVWLNLFMGCLGKATCRVLLISDQNRPLKKKFRCTKAKEYPRIYILWSIVKFWPLLTRIIKTRKRVI